MAASVSHRRRFETSSLTARVMLSPEPWSAGYRAGGYPLLLQTGETYAPLQHLPELVIEGMVIAALVVGARQVIVYLRHEYTRERETLHKEVQQRTGALDSLP